jgi:hypothetical protein
LNGAGGGLSTNASYVFAGDMNGDGGSGNDLIYIPKNTSEMNFVQFAQGGITFTPEQQATAFEAYINQDPYLSKHRGEYAERGGIYFPMQKRMDLSITQDVFTNLGGKRNAGQFRIDFTNFETSESQLGCQPAPGGADHAGIRRPDPSYPAVDADVSATGWPCPTTSS